MAGVNIGIGISLPPPIVFEAPPDVIVLPDTNDAYVVPDETWTSFSGMVGGGVRGKDVGIAHGIITGAGVIITMFQVFILMLIQVGEDTTETIIGTDTGGTMNGFLTNDVDRTGRAGIIIDIGKGKELGASRAINLDHNNRDRN